METTRVVHVLIRGGVQGVGFRAWTQHQAELRGLEGWVRNRRDGSVEAVFSGAAPAVQTMLQACRQGPLGARVDEVEAHDGQAAELPRLVAGRFQVLATV
jgi:acylphosphatase